MRLRRHNMRLSTRLLFIVLTCLLPVIVLGVWVEYSHWAERRAQLGDLSLQQAQLLNGDVDSIAEGARTLLTAVAQLDEVRDATPAAANGCARPSAACRCSHSSRCSTRAAT